MGGQVNVYVFDGSSQLVSADLIGAETLVANIFRNVGVQVTWIEDASAVDLRLRIWESSTLRGTRVTSDSLATARSNGAHLLYAYSCRGLGC
jgi:hypothetical protein